MRGGVCLLVLAAARIAAADEVAPPEKGAEPKLIEPAHPGSGPAAATSMHSHLGQLELSLRLPIGMRAIAPYDNVNYCGKTDPSAKYGNAPVCTARAPFSIDLELGYGIAKRIDLLFEMRLGLESDFAATPAGTDGPHPFHISPGARFFFSEAKRTKLFTTAQVVFDFEGYNNAGGMARGTDFGVRNLNGLWVDLERAYGIYGYVGETATFARWMRFELELGIGFQGRYR